MTGVTRDGRIPFDTGSFSQIRTGLLVAEGIISVLAERSTLLVLLLIVLVPRPPSEGMDVLIQQGSGRCGVTGTITTLPILTLSSSFHVTHLSVLVAVEGTDLVVARELGQAFADRALVTAIPGALRLMVCREEHPPDLVALEPADGCFSIPDGYQEVRGTTARNAKSSIQSVGHGLNLVESLSLSLSGSLSSSMGPGHSSILSRLGISTVELEGVPPLIALNVRPPPTLRSYKRVWVWGNSHVSIAEVETGVPAMDSIVHDPLGFGSKWTTTRVHPLIGIITRRYPGSPQVLRGGEESNSSLLICSLASTPSSYPRCSGRMLVLEVGPDLSHTATGDPHPTCAFYFR